MVGNKMLIPLDGSELAEAALPYAERLSAALGWTALLLRVVHPEAHHSHGSVPIEEGGHQELRSTGRVSVPWSPGGSVPIEEGGHQGVAEEDRALRAAAREQVRALEAAAMEELAGPEQRLRAAGVLTVREVGVGDPKAVIAERASEDDVAIIVMASHGRTGLARLFRGSVADAVARSTTRPTLLVRPFRDADHRVDLEHAEQLPQDQVDVVRRVMEAPPS
ncbi:MAG TPA: universal stress protein [Chloroflexota bacterium]|nr:universal stress protein [Chloroflexota bacterium]